MPVWIRVPNLPIEYYEKHILWRLGDLFGKTLKIDEHTLKEQNGKVEVERANFARVCKEIDLRKKLLSKFRQFGRVHHIEYEGLRLVCFDCGKFGHNKEGCPNNRKEGDPSNKESKEPITMKGDNRRVEVGKEALGPWMHVQRNSRRRPRGGQSGARTEASKDHNLISESRFQAIAQLADKEGNDETIDNQMNETSGNLKEVQVEQPAISQIPSKEVAHVPINAKGVKVKSRKMELANLTPKKSGGAPQPTSDNRKTKPPYEKASEHIVITSVGVSRKQQNQASPANDKCQIFFESTLEDWLGSNLVIRNESWNSKFALTCWPIWKRRRSWVFQNVQKDSMYILTAVNRYMDGLKEANIFKVGASKTLDSEELLIRWYPPKEEWVKLNVEGSCWTHIGAISCGGALRDESGRWVSGFTRKMGIGNSTMAEAWAIKTGVEDCHPLNLIINGIRHMASLNWEVTFDHALRESNRVANSLANWAHKWDFGVVTYDRPPLFCSTFVQDDAREMGMGKRKEMAGSSV
ncbi:LIM domain-containing protein A-like [Senna tora]|uniref:LIM domain-containing protein A-like n=1 Tax=Senna tora TaxID=362788 RepID=A0A834WVL7_9FABA|nr:LIM domain-containing protein A-like [Senna tora]